MQSGSGKRINQPPAVYLLSAASLKDEGLCSGVSQVKSVLRSSCLWLRCWSLHKHWLLAEGKSYTQKGPGSGGLGKSKNTSNLLFFSYAFIMNTLPLTRSLAVVPWDE